MRPGRAKEAGGSPARGPRRSAKGAPAIAKIALVGARGAGKSTLGRALAARLCWGFVDTDDALAARVGQSAAAYLADHGEPAFRHVERSVVLAALERPGRDVIALGGGAVTISEVRAALRWPSVLAVLLVAPVDVLVARLRAEPRPKLTDLPLEQEVVRLLERRHAAFTEVAAITLETFPANVDACCTTLLATITPLLSSP